MGRSPAPPGPIRSTRGRPWQARLLALLALFVLSASTAWSQPARAAATETPPSRTPLYFFWSATCPHCLAARPQILALATAHPWIELHDLEISRHPEHLERYGAMAAELGEDARAVPALIYCGRMDVGWDESASAPRLLAALEACRAAPGTEHSQATQAPPEPALELPGLGRVDAAHLSLPLLTLVIAGLDAFNPCAFFVLLFLLSLLVHQRDRRRMLLVGGVFVACSGLMYFAFMAAWLGLFLVLGSLPWITGAAGALALVMGLINIKDCFAFRQGPSLSIPESRKPGLFQRGRAILAAGSLPAMLAATLLLALAANFYELLCTAGLPMVYTRLLTLQEPDPFRQTLYLALYNLVYVLPLAAIVLACTASMGRRQLSEREGRLLKLLSGLMMAGLGLLLLAAPEHLNRLPVALGLLAGAVGITWAVARFIPERAGPPPGARGK